ncbi:MAG: hypothetical protein WCH46_06155 [bacterium]
METQSQAIEELAFIKKIISESRESFVEDGKPYILWGVIVALGMTLTYISAMTQTELYVGYIWLGLSLLGWATIIYFVKDKKKKAARTRSFVDRIQGAIWGACGMAIGLTVVLIIVRDNMNINDVPPIHQYYICFITAIIIGIAYFLSGIANDLKWLSNIGYGWWAGAIVMILFPSVHILLLYAILIVLFHVVPGIILMKRYKAIITKIAN